ncbi:hypothetical protein [Streptomyces sp. CB03911]|uniref:hypothetical protein n=1 Tax=Streptomyces sp. CB03911 TaxID=1804758 RepID=UPI00093DCFDE|nr:hypothetical protein [Streptomyces sp. CB03911]OKI25090.1 hypothetical protein A6A07_31325 [Streptomyces sp. CB03911]
MAFDLTDNVHHADHGRVQQLEHFQQPFVAVPPGDTALEDMADVPRVSASTAQGLADHYLHEVAPIYGIDAAMLPGNGRADSLTGPESDTGRSRLELADEKEILGTTVVSYQQKYGSLPVWEAGVSVTIQPGPMRVTASQSSVQGEVLLPEESLTAGQYGPEAITPAVLVSLLGVQSAPTLNATPSRLVYQYDPDRRFDPEARAATGERLEEVPPTLSLPPVPGGIAPQEFRVVTEVLFTLPVPGHPALNWRAFVDAATGAVLYLRALTACATGMVFRTDPLTAGGAAPAPAPTDPAATLNPFRSTVLLEGLAVASPQQLSGDFVKLVDTAPPVAVPPNTPNPAGNFFFDAPAREFAAVNAYHHCDWLFRQMAGMGFNLSTYFDGTVFPVPVDAVAFNDQVNARAPGNATGTGSGGFEFGLAGAPFPAVSIAADRRVVLHEFGHTLLWDSVHSPNFGFAHSAGDGLAAVFMDPESSLRTDPVKRFQTFPWILPDRNHGRDVATGWAWGGVNDIGGYSSEQILSTTHFRLYRSLGGDSENLDQRRLAARQTMYLIFRAIGSLASGPITPTPNPGVFTTALMNADIGTADFEGYLGGTHHKVIRWSFEKQGLFQPPGAPTPVTAPGAPPAVDVFIDDGRAGEYQFQPVHWETTEIWNRLAPNPGGGVHETPVVGLTNHAYVRIRNRGSQPATNVVVRGYSANPGVGLSWPGDWKPMDIAQISVPGGVPAGGSAVVGPFRWRPQSIGHECMFMEVSANGDPSNIDPATFFPCAAGPTAEWRLVPFDNNLAQRNVAPVAGGGGLRGLLSSFVERRFTVRNPFDHQVRIVLKAFLPPFLAERGWTARLENGGNKAVFGLAAGESRPVAVTLRPGQDFTREDLLQAGAGVRIRVVATADGMTVGGMTYQLDPELVSAPREHADHQPIGLDHAEIDAAIRESELQGEVPATATAGTAVAASGEGRAAGTTGGAAHHPNGDGEVGRILDRLGASEELRGRIQRVTLREVDVSIEMDTGHEPGAGNGGSAN